MNDAALSDRPATLNARALTTGGLCFLVALVDGYDAQSIGFVGAEIMATFDASPAELGGAFSSALVGLMFGAIVGGAAGDRFGARPVIVAACVLMGVFSIATAIAQNLSVFVAARFLTGLGLGAALPCINALTASAVRPAHRARAMTIMYSGVPIGAIAGGLVAAFAIEETDWRFVFVVGAVAPLVLAPLLWLLLPRSPPDIRDTAQGRWRLLLGSAHLWTTTRICIVFFVNLLLVYVLINWLPILLVRFGVDPAAARSAPIAFNVGGIVGGLLLATLADRVGRARVGAGALAGASATAFALAVWSSAGGQTILLAACALLGACIGGAQFILNVLAVERYADSVRATGLGLAMSVGRTGAIVGPAAIGAAIEFGHSEELIFGALGGCALLGAIVVMSLNTSEPTS